MVKITGLEEFQKKLIDLSIPILKKDAEDAGKACVDQMKYLISIGHSPIDGSKFPAYKNPKSYPGSAYIQKKYPGKSYTPVNLRLSGDFLDDLKSKADSIGISAAFTVYYDSELSRKKEQGHREGAKGQPSRPTIPQGSEDSEDFAPSVREAYMQIVYDAIKRFLD